MNDLTTGGGQRAEEVRNEAENTGTTTQEVAHGQGNAENIEADATNTAFGKAKESGDEDLSREGNDNEEGDDAE
jgi:hypothetical protein